MADILITPFINDMFSIVYKAFTNLYPNKKCEVQWMPEIKDENGEIVFGCTTFNEDGAFVDISAGSSVMGAVEVLAHELAHVAVGIENEHGKEWQDAFDAIFNEYGRIANEML